MSLSVISAEYLIDFNENFYDCLVKKERADEFAETTFVYIFIHRRRA